MVRDPSVGFARIVSSDEELFSTSGEGGVVRGDMEGLDPCLLLL